MSASDQPPLKRLWTAAREYVTHWFAAGVILTLTGFTPDHWVERLLHTLKLPDDFTLFSGADFRHIGAGVGVALIAGDVFFRNRRGRKEPINAVPTTEDLDDIAHKPSIAVLPFVNMSADKSQEYFADGMTEDIITGLSFDSRLFVIARNSTAAYKGQTPDIRTVGKELGVRYVLEGSVRPVNDRLRITVQLIETASGAHVWADKIERPVAEIFDIMDDVVDGLVTTLCTNLGMAESNRAKRQRPEDLQAWALCVQAEVIYNTEPDIKNILVAEKLAQRAADIEPGYAVSWALLALLTSMPMTWGRSADLGKDSEKVMSLVNKAMRLAPSDPVVLSYYAYASIWAGETAQAVDWLERSLAINPNSSFSRVYYGAVLCFGGRPEDGRTQLELFIRRAPKDPYIGYAYFFLAWCYLILLDHPQAEHAARNCVKNWSSTAWGYLLLAMCLAALGHDGEAKPVMQKVRQLEPDWTRQRNEEFIRHVFGKSGNAEMVNALTRKIWRD